MTLRTPKETTSDRTHDEIYPLIHQYLKRTNTPMICNGDIWCSGDVENIRSLVFPPGNDNECSPFYESTEAIASKRKDESLCFMLSRPALWNPAVFSELKVKKI